MEMSVVVIMAVVGVMVVLAVALVMALVVAPASHLINTVCHPGGADRHRLLLPHRLDSGRRRRSAQ